MTTLPVDSQLTSMGWQPRTATELGEQLSTSPQAMSHEVIAPFTGTALHALPLSSTNDVDAAVARARTAQGSWARTSVRDRVAILLGFHDLLLARRDEVLDLIQFETGKARRDALEEVLDVCIVIQHYARRAGRLLQDSRHRGAIPVLTTVREVRHPVGVVGVIAPWNYPLSLAASDAVAALIAGNAVVVKPDMQTSLTAAWVRLLLAEAGLTPELYEVVTGDGASIGGALIDRVDFVMFTGSTQTGRIVAARCGERLIGATMELGGKNALIVRADVDLNRAARIAVQAIVANAGQLCISMERLYVADAIFDAFVDRVSHRMRALTIATAPGWGADMGPLINAAHFQRVDAQVRQARECGAHVITGGHAVPERGPLAYAPTLLTGVTESMQLCRAETFGPVASVYAVADDEEAIAAANDTEYGLNAAILTTDARTGQAMARRLNSGSVNINDGYAAAWGSVAAPLGGRGASGIGVRHGDEGLLAYTQAQTIAQQRVLGFAAPAGISDRRWGQLLAQSTRIMRPWSPRPRRKHR